MRTRVWLLAALVLSVFTVDVRAQADSQVSSIKREVKVSSGREVRARLAVSPEHGAVTVKRAMLKVTNLKQCLAVEAPALVALYRAVQNFDGVDRFELEIAFSDGGKQLQYFNVSVSKAMPGRAGNLGEAKRKWPVLGAAFQENRLVP